MRLVDLDGLSYAEAAGVLGAPGGTVMSRLHRGRARIRASLESRIYTQIKSALTRQGEPVDPAAVQRLTDFGQALPERLRLGPPRWVVGSGRIGCGELILGSGNHT